MLAIEISGTTGPGTIVRIQQLPDDRTLEDGRVLDAEGRPCFPTTSRWYPAPEGAREKGQYDPETGVASPPPDPREQYTLAEYKQRQQPAVRAAAVGAFNEKWTAFDIYAAARQDTGDRSQIDADAQAIKVEYQRVRKAVIDATTYDEVDAAVASADFTI